ncbi:unnamed protein product [Clonostachys rhizophaga]|uniref:Cyanovirin-N domain-containing protein n=1 Tax=Clonostachys rhizophaga TaxID=160324 RepID=A0A9N9YSF5_9HYPO|nr:unnamed protein product [Clonostachys rhizophaga]
MAIRTAVILSLIGSTFAQISRSCVDIALDSATNVLSAKCTPADHSAAVPTSLDLNLCIGYDGTQLTATRPGNFGTSCSGCSLYTGPDPWYSTEVYWISCTCTGQSAASTINLEVASAHQYITNNNGKLTC